MEGTKSIRQCKCSWAIIYINHHTASVTLCYSLTYASSTLISIDDGKKHEQDLAYRGAVEAGVVAFDSRGCVLDYIASDGTFASSVSAESAK